MKTAILGLSLLVSTVQGTGQFKLVTPMAESCGNISDYTQHDAQRGAEIAADHDANKVCNGSSTRISEYAFTEKCYQSGPFLSLTNLSVRAVADYECNNK